MKTNKLYLSPTNKKIAGVCGGIEEAYGLDATLCRLILVILVLATGIVPGVIVYLLAIIIIPGKPENNEIVDVKDARSGEGSKNQV